MASRVTRSPFKEEVWFQEEPQYERSLLDLLVRFEMFIRNVVVNEDYS